jgi:hypothetical protein
MSPLSTVAALLAKAERTDNPHEAEAYLAKAQHLATLAAIDLADAREHQERRDRRAEPTNRTITIGERGKRANPHLVRLFLAVADVNDVRVDISKRSTYVVAYGMPSDVDVVSAIWASLAQQMVAAAGAYLASDVWRGEWYEPEWRPGMDDDSPRPHTAQTARTAFYQAFVVRIAARLREARAAALAQHDAEHPAESPGETAAAGAIGGAVVPSAVGAGGGALASRGALVLRAKRDEVDAFHRRTSKAKGTWGGYGGAVGLDAGGPSQAGRRAATAARLGPSRPLPGPRAEVSA